ncbi:B-box zinc finger protein [Corallococcus sp. M7]
MHPIDIPSGAMNEFDLPPICIVTGERQGVVFKPVQFSWYPRWIGFLALLNLLIAIIVAAAMTKRVKGTLPFTEEAWSRWRRGQVVMGVSVVAAIALLILSFSLLASDAPEWQGLVTMASSVALPVLIWVFLLRNRGPQVRRIDPDNISIVIPNGPAAHAITGHFLSGLHAPVGNAEAGLDADGAPDRAVCARHEDIVANQVCTRCGAFMCPRCERRVRREAPPMCPGCWELRIRSVEKPPDSFFTAPNVGLQLALVSLIPFCFILQPVALVLNGVNLVKARREGGSRPDQRKAMAGLVLSGLGAVLSVALYALGSRP